MSWRKSPVNPDYSSRNSDAFLTFVLIYWHLFTHVELIFDLYKPHSDLWMPIVGPLFFKFLRLVFLSINLTLRKGKVLRSWTSGLFFAQQGWQASNRPPFGRDEGFEVDPEIDGRWETLLSLRKKRSAQRLLCGSHQLLKSPRRPRLP